MIPQRLSVPDAGVSMKRSLGIPDGKYKKTRNATNSMPRHSYFDSINKTYAKHSHEKCKLRTDKKTRNTRHAKIQEMQTDKKTRNATQYMPRH